MKLLFQVRGQTFKIFLCYKTSETSDARSGQGCSAEKHCFFYAVTIITAGKCETFSSLNCECRSERFAVVHWLTL